GGDGLEAARTGKLHRPRCGISLMTAYDDEEQLFQAIKVGASAFYLKDIRPDEILEGIRRAAAGEYLINESVLTRPLVASRVLKQFRDLSMVGQEMEPLFVPLSAREIEVLDYIARGNSNKEIARAARLPRGRPQDARERPPRRGGADARKRGTAPADLRARDRGRSGARAGRARQRPRGALRRDRAAAPPGLRAPADDARGGRA